VREARAEVAERDFAESEQKHCENEVWSDEREISHHFIA
jgi:hypothetical protein